MKADELSVEREARSQDDQKPDGEELDVTR
jgi:hypothetical protein